MTKKDVKKLVEKLCGIRYCAVWFYYRKVDKVNACSRKDFYCCKYCEKTWCQVRCSAVKLVTCHCGYKLATLEKALEEYKKNGKSFTEFIRYIIDSEEQ